TTPSSHRSAAGPKSGRRAAPSPGSGRRDTTSPGSGHRTASFPRIRPGLIPPPLATTKHWRATPTPPPSMKRRRPTLSPTSVCRKNKRNRFLHAKGHQVLEEVWCLMKK
uniref:Uncharacterized protein n=1 Tax=Triticum urartu TaxID=4572 RepID=A0A8R7TV08_TRIUA